MSTSSMTLIILIKRGALGKVVCLGQNQNTQGHRPDEHLKSERRGEEGCRGEAR